MSGSLGNPHDVDASPQRGVAGGTFAHGKVAHNTVAEQRKLEVGIL